MDNYDWKLLAALQADGRLTNQELGAAIGLSPSQCSRRRLSLEQSGVIGGYMARLNDRALGLDVLAFVHVNLRSHDAKSTRDFQRLVDREDFIQEAHAVSGDADYLLKVVARDLEQLSKFITHSILASTVVNHVKSYIVLQRMKQTSALPLRD